MSNSDQPLSIANLKKTYRSRAGGAVEAVRQVSFDVGRGEVFGLLGPNGAGKTSIISMITTIEKPTVGDVQVFGESVQKNPKFTKNQMGVVPQELINQGFFNLFELLKFQSGYQGLKKNEDHIEWLLKRLGLWEHRQKMVRQLSGGMKRRFMIAKSLVHRPRLLLLDEPTAGVDIELRATLWEFVRELKSEGVSVLLTTHYLQEAEELCDRVGIIDRGELKYVGPTKQIIKDLTKRTVELTLRGQISAKLEGSPYFVSAKGKSLVYSVPHGMPVGDLLDQLQIPHAELFDIKTREGTLEEAFLSLVHQGGRL